MKLRIKPTSRHSAQYEAPHNRTIDLETEYLKIRINNKGHQTGLIDKSSGKNYLQSVAPLWKAIIGRKEYECSRIEIHGRDLTVHFGGKAVARFRFQNKKYYFTLELVTVQPNIAQISMIEFNLKKMETIAKTINAAYDENFAFCVMALTLPAHCKPAGSNLRATCYAKYGFQGNKIAIIGCPTRQLKPLIQQVEKAEGLPHITLGGKWSKVSNDIKHSYLFLHDLGEVNCNRAIAYARKMNVGMIMILETWAGRTMGHFPINRNLFPHGQEGLKAVVAKIHKAGMKAGLHFLSTGVSHNDRYISPVPDKRLFKDAAAILAGDIDSTQVDIPCLNYPAGFPRSLHPRGIYFGNGVDIQIDDEIISYGSISLKKPFQFANCHRGAYGTKAAPHHKGSKIVHLMRSYSYFVADRDTSLMNEIAERICKILDDCRFDMLYFDGNERLQGDLWYYHCKTLMAFYHCISPSRRNHILFQSSSGGQAHFSSHLISRTACADGYENVKDNVNNASTKYPTYINNFMPLDIGWYGIGQKEISCSDIEYVLGKSIGWNSSVGFSTSLQALDLNPETTALLEMAGKYESLRLKNWFPESVKKTLRQPLPCHLVKLPESKWGFAAQHEKIIRTTDGIDNVWTMPCTTSNKMIELQIAVGEITRPGSIYRNHESVNIIDFHDNRIVKYDRVIGLMPFGEDTHAINKTSAAFTCCENEGPCGNNYGLFTVKSRLKDRSGWTGFGHRYGRPLKLGRRSGIGLWVGADGKGAGLKIRLQDIAGNWLDYNLKLDFLGWRYHELADFNDIVNPDYLEEIDKSKIAVIMFFLVRLPPGDETTCRIAGIKALPQLEKEKCLNHPSITVEKQTISFPGRLKQGDLLTSSADGKCVTIDRQGKEHVLHPAGRMPVFKKGKNTVTFKSANDLSNEIKIRISNIPDRA